MSTLSVPPTPRPVEYPETHGAPIAENTLRFEWIVKIVGGLRALFADAPDAFVAGDLFWYPVDGRPEIVAAPDAMVVFGRPKGFRRSYKQWEEGGIGPQVAFEVLSPRNRFGDLLKKFEFYRTYGVEEYYIYNPGPLGSSLSVYLREGEALAEVPERAVNGFVSPRLGVRFEIDELTDLRIVRPDGRPFMSVEELDQRAEHERERAERAAREVEQPRERLRSLGQDAG